jgi:hypothetical protein
MKPLIPVVASKEALREYEASVMNAFFDSMIMSFVTHAEFAETCVEKVKEAAESCNISPDIQDQAVATAKVHSTVVKSIMFNNNLKLAQVNTFGINIATFLRSQAVRDASAMTARDELNVPVSDETIRVCVDSTLNRIAEYFELSARSVLIETEDELAGKNPEHAPNKPH